MTTTFPQSDRVVFNHNPLEEVICQLRFPPILEISVEKPAAFQNKMRSDYPLYKVDQPSLPKEISELMDFIPTMKPQDNISHKFMTENETKSISLCSDFIAYSDRDYET